MICILNTREPEMMIKYNLIFDPNVLGLTELTSKCELAVISDTARQCFLNMRPSRDKTNSPLSCQSSLEMIFTHPVLEKWQVLSWQLMTTTLLCEKINANPIALFTLNSELPSSPRVFAAIVILLDSERPNQSGERLIRVTAVSLSLTAH